MPSVKFDISEAEEVARYLGFSIDAVAKRAILATANRVVQHITTQIIPNTSPQPVDRGAFRAGWKAKKDPDGAEVRNTLPYASIIEYGARAENIKIGRKMIEALAAWVRRKGIGGSKTASGRVRRPSVEEATSIAWAIAKTMQKKGIFNGGKGLRVLERALVIVQNAFAQELKTELEREYR
jgi:Bacteriophage HK97-gp10, putative tail-component